MAEMETYHSQKVEDFETLAKDHLDGEIALYEQVCRDGIFCGSYFGLANCLLTQILTRLQIARSSFDKSTGSFTHLSNSSSLASPIPSFSPLSLPSSSSLITPSYKITHTSHIPPTSQNRIHRSPSPRKPSIYERELDAPRLIPAPLPQPCPHVFDSTPMRPVSVAIGGAVGGLLGGTRGEGRGSVFGGLFW